MTAFILSSITTRGFIAMGKNWHEYIIEAKRCLVTNSILIIAETDEERGDFTFIEAREL
jgi:hypothetical protein